MKIPKCHCGGKLVVEFDTQSGGILAVCEKCKREGPTIPGPKLPMSVKDFVAGADRLSFLAIGEYFKAEPDAAP